MQRLLLIIFISLNTSHALQVWRWMVEEGTKAEVITYASIKMILQKSNVLMIGDREHDVIGAHANH